jgi:hypothetical protein
MLRRMGMVRLGRGSTQHRPLGQKGIFKSCEAGATAQRFVELLPYLITIGGLRVATRPCPKPGLANPLGVTHDAFDLPTGRSHAPPEDARCYAARACSAKSLA